MKRLLKLEYLGIVGIVVMVATLFLWVDFVNHERFVTSAEAAEQETPVYIILKEPILIEIEVDNCSRGICRKEKDTGMVYKIRAGTTNITDHGMVNIIPYHKEARELLGDHLRIPIVNIKCIATGDNKIQGHMWE